MRQRPRPEDLTRTQRLGVPGPDSTGDRSSTRDRLAGQTADRTAPREGDLEPSPTDPAIGDGSASQLVAETFRRRGPVEPPGPDRVAEPACVPSALVNHQDLIHTMGARKRGHDRVRRAVAEGEELFGFRLRHELGRGAFASVYLAEQRDLACRPVVLKISATEGTEHQTLARLQHTNIVPIFSAHEDEGAGLRAVCMPYFGGTTLANVLERLWDGTPRPTLGGEMAEALEAVGSPAVPAGSEGPEGGARPGPTAHEPRARPRRPWPSGAGSATTRRPRGSRPIWPRGSITPTSGGSSTAISSRRTSCSAPRGSRSSWTSTWPRR